MELVSAKRPDRVFRAVSRPVKHLFLISLQAPDLKAPFPVCWRRNSVGRLISGSLIYDYSGTCVGALRDRHTHDARARHQAVEEEETRHEHSCVYGGRALERAAERRHDGAVGGGREWRLSRVAT